MVTAKIRSNRFNHYPITLRAGSYLVNFKTIFILPLAKYQCEWPAYLAAHLMIKTCFSSWWSHDKLDISWLGMKLQWAAGYTQGFYKAAQIFIYSRALLNNCEISSWLLILLHNLSFKHLSIFRISAMSADSVMLLNNKTKSRPSVNFSSITSTFSQSKPTRIMQDDLN